MTNDQFVGCGALYLEEVIVKSTSEMFDVITRGSAKRRTEATLCNKQSSRSHSLFSVSIHMKV